MNTQECTRCNHLINLYRTILDKLSILQREIHIKRQRLVTTRTLDNVSPNLVRILAEDLAFSLLKLGICHYNIGLLLITYKAHYNIHTR